MQDQLIFSQVIFDCLKLAQANNPNAADGREPLLLSSR